MMPVTTTASHQSRQKNNKRKRNSKPSAGPAKRRRKVRGQQKEPIEDLVRRINNAVPRDAEDPAAQLDLRLGDHFKFKEWAFSHKSIQAHVLTVETRDELHRFWIANLCFNRPHPNSTGSDDHPFHRTGGHFGLDDESVNARFKEMKDSHIFETGIGKMMVTIKVYDALKLFQQLCRDALGTTTRTL